MTANTSQQPVLSTIWQLFSSVRLTIGVLLTIAGTAVLGTIIPQNKPLDFYRIKYAEPVAKMITGLHLFDMYDALWFQGLILVLALNLLACSWERWKLTSRIVFPEKITFSRGAFKKTTAVDPVTVKASLDALEKVFTQKLAGQFSATATETTANGRLFFGEKGRKSRLGVYGVHLSVLLLLAGTMVSSFYGFEGYVTLPEGETVSTIQLREASGSRPLGFEIRCDAFDVSFYDSGRPKQYLSTLTIIEDDKKVLTEKVRVNQPLRYKGINIFQSTYGTNAVKNIDLSFTSRKSGKTYHRKMNLEESVKLPEGLGTFTVTAFNDSYRHQMMGKTINIGETLLGTIKKQDNKERVALPLRFENFDKMRRGDVFISVDDYERTYYTGLQVRKDPGVPIVYTSFILIIIGIYITFFISHQRFCIEASETENTGETRVAVFWKTNKNKQAARKKAEHLRNKLSEGQN